MNSTDQRKPAQSYCLCITRKRLLSLWLAVLLLFVAVAMGVYGWVEIQADKSAWEFADYAKMVVGWGGALIFLIWGLATAYTALRDALFPAQSALARSIRSQLPDPDAAPGVKELFAMVDRDIEENGRWFDRIAVGKEWVLGDVASYIPRIRVFFGRDEIRSRRAGERTNTTRILELHILDDRRQHQINTLRKARELKPLLECISLRAPDALCRPYSEYHKWNQKSDMEWENMLREYRVKQGEREMADFQLGQDTIREQNVTLIGPDGSATSRVTPDLIHKMLIECLEQGEGTFSLIPGQPQESNGIRFIELECWARVDEDEDLEELSQRNLEDLGMAELYLKMSQMAGGEVLHFSRVCETDIPSAEQILKNWFHGEIPDLKGWEATPLYMERNQEKKREIPPPHLGLMSASGVFQSHDRFDMEDVQVAAEGLVDGTYQMVDLTLKGGYLWMRIQGGDKTDGRCTVSVTRADPDKLRFFKNKCTHRQAAAWLMEFANGNFQPDQKEWKDHTRQMEREMNKF